MDKKKRRIEMIPIDRINFLNPRVRNQKIFNDIAHNITQVGLKRPITVAPCVSKTPDSRSLRSALSTGTHETLHSDDEQKIVRLGYNESKFNTYAASFGEEAKPNKIQLSDPLGYTAAALHWTNAGRTTYVSSETNFDIYRQQPFEKYAWSFQNQFAAALNGALVFHQVETGNRVLRDDLRSLFQKVGQVLGARKDITGDSSDTSTDKSGRPVFALIARKPLRFSPSCFHSASKCRLWVRQKQKRPR